jgi:hypothetical protein
MPPHRPRELSAENPNGGMALSPSLCSKQSAKARQMPSWAGPIPCRTLLVVQAKRRRIDHIRDETAGHTRIGIST